MGNQKICLLGATGFIGSSISDALTEANLDWIGLTRHPSSHKNLQQVSYEDATIVCEIINEYPVVINALGSLKPKDFICDFKNSLESFWTMNNVLETLLSNSNLEKLVHISSAGTVYGETSKRSSEENDLLFPKSWYGRTKVIEENQLAQLCIRKKIPFLCARISNPFGNANTTFHGFIDVLLDSIRRNEGFKTYFGEQTCRNFIYAPDMARLILRLILNGSHGIYNIGSENSTYLADILDMVKKKVEDIDIKYEHLNTNTDVINNTISVEKIKNNLDLKTTSEINVFDYINDQIEKMS